MGSLRIIDFQTTYSVIVLHAKQTFVPLIIAWKAAEIV